MVMAQSHTASREPASILPPLPETSMQPMVSTTAVSSAPGVRYQYQLVHFDNDRIYLAPAWRGLTKLTPPRKFLNPDAAGDLDGLLLTTINELAAEGWSMVEIRAVTRPVQAVQKVERELQFNDPERPVYKGTTSISSSIETHYLFRRALSD
jgi:hypothetical protein